VSAPTPTLNPTTQVLIILTGLCQGILQNRPRFERQFCVRCCRGREIGPRPLGSRPFPVFATVVSLPRVPRSTTAGSSTGTLPASSYKATPRPVLHDLGGRTR